MIYKAYFSANGNTLIMTPYWGYNKSKLIKYVREVANSERYEGNICIWFVIDNDGYCQAAGGTDNTGRQYRMRPEDVNLQNIIKKNNTARI